MTIITSVFLMHKKAGSVFKIGTAWFFDGNRHMERTLWHDRDDDTAYVILKGEAYNFRKYTNQPHIEDNIWIGHI